MPEEAAVALPRYRSHKEVWALKIKEIQAPPAAREPDAKGGHTMPAAMIIPEDSAYGPFTVSGEYLLKHNPQPGGYWVKYADNYESFSPAAAFEEGYTRIP